MNSNDAGTAPPKSAPERPPRRRRILPPAWVWVIAGVCLAAMIFIAFAGRLADLAPEGLPGAALLWMGDHANGNVLMLIFGFAPFFWFGVWFVFRSGFRWPVRLVALGCVLLMVAALPAIFRIKNVSGELFPTFTWRWVPDPDSELEQPHVRHEIDLTTTTDFDYPGFLGRDRDATLADVQLGPWTPATGKPLWRRKIGAGWSAFAAVNGYAVTMEQRGELEMVTCYDVSTGRMMWQDRVKTRHVDFVGGDGPRCTPTIHEGMVYALGATGILSCLDGADGRKVWRVDLLKSFGVKSLEADLDEVSWGRSSSPLIVDDLVIVPAGGPARRPVSLAAFDRMTGKEVWRAGKHQVAYSSPTLREIDGVRQVVCTVEGYLIAVSPQDGRLLWEHPWPSDSSAESSPAQPVVWPDGRVLVVKAYGQGAELFQVQQEGDDWTTETIWHKPAVLRVKFSQVVVMDGFAYGLSDGILECVRVEDGRRRWKDRDGRYGHGQILLAGDSLLVLAESGELARVQATPEEFREIDRFQAIEGKTWNNMCLHGPYLLVRNAEQAACFKLPLVE